MAMLSQRHRRMIVFGLLGIALMAVGLELYLRWVARNLGIIVEAAVETPRRLGVALTSAPENSVVVMPDGDTVADITSLAYPSGRGPDEVNGYVGILTDSAAVVQLMDSAFVGFLLHNDPVVIQIRRGTGVSTSSRRLWLVNLSRRIPVYIPAEIPTAEQMQQ